MITMYAGPQKVEDLGGVSGIEMKLLADNFDNLIEIGSFRAVEILANAGVDILNKALPKTPVDTGELRRSGLALLNVGSKILVLAKGTKSGYSRKQGGYKSLNPKLIGKYMRRTSTAFVSISFDKVVGGRDIALWTHEILNPFGSDFPPRARTPGTGPKYLEMAFNERKGYWLDQLKQLNTRISADTRSTAITVKRPTESWAVSAIKIVTSRVRKLFRGNK